MYKVFVFFLLVEDNEMRFARIVKGGDENEGIGAGSAGKIASQARAAIIVLATFQIRARYKVRNLYIFFLFIYIC